MNPAPHGRRKIRYADEAFERYSEKLRAMQQQPAMLEASEDVDAADAVDAVDAVDALDALDAVDQEADAAH